jgi:hypothetical protein
VSPVLSSASELVKVGALARDQCDIISGLGKEASDDAQCKREQSRRRTTYAEAPPVPEAFPTPATTKMGRVDMMVVKL